MPRYDYKCSGCEESFVAMHGITETLEECSLCGRVGTVKKVPSLPFVFQKNNLQKPGEFVKMYIEETKQSLVEEKQSYRKDYNPNDNNN